MTVIIHGYRYSVYVRIVRMALIEKGVGWGHVEIDPFAETPSADYLRLNPFGRVPTLRDGDFTLYETTAITRYVDERFPGISLQPEPPRERARMNQMISIIDSYGYRPMVRQVFSQRVFNPALGNAPDEAMIAEGLARSAVVLDAIEGFAGDGPFLVGDRLSLADIHLAPMIAYFAAAPEGCAVLSKRRKLTAWWLAMRRRPSVIETEPGLPSA